MPLVLELIGNIGSLGLIGYFAWALVADGRGMMAVVFGVIALAATFLYPMLLRRVVHSTMGPDFKLHFGPVPQTKTQRVLFPGFSEPPKVERRWRAPRTFKMYAKPIGMLAISALLGKAFGAW